MMRDRRDVRRDRRATAMTAASPRRRSGSPSGFDVDQAILAVRGDVDVLDGAHTRRDAWTCSSTKATRTSSSTSPRSRSWTRPGSVSSPTVSARLAESGRVLTMRAAPAQTRRILDITGVNALVRLESVRSERRRLGAEQRSDDHSVAVVTEPADLSADLARVGTKPNDAVIDAALRLVTRPGRFDRRGRRRRQRHARTRRPPGDGGVDQRHRPADG